MKPDARGAKAYSAGYKGGDAKNPFNYGPNNGLAAWWDAGRSDALAGKPCRFGKKTPTGIDRQGAAGIHCKCQ